MRFIKKLLSSEELWVVFVIVFSVGITLNLFFSEVISVRKLSPDRFATFEHNFLPDFNAYLSKMTQGGKGQVLVHERFTSEPHEPSLLQIFYLILGKITIGIMGLRADFAYHFSRFVLAVIRLFAAYYFILAIMPGREKKLLRFLAFFLFAFSGNFPLKITNPAEFGVPLFGAKYRMVFDQWSNLDPLIRLSYLPHWMAGQSAIMIGLAMMVKQGESLKKAIGIGLIGMVGGFILPSVPLIMIPVWWIAAIFKRENLKSVVAGSIIMAIPLVYIKWVTGFLPWSALAASDAGVTMKFPWESYIKALGTTGILGIIGGLFVLIMGIVKRREKAPQVLTALLWVGVTFFSIWVFDTFLHYDQRRFVQVGVELPLSILTVFLLDIVVGAFLKIIRLNKLKGAVLLMTTVLLLIPSFIVWYISYQSRLVFVRERINAAYPLVSVTPYVVYQPKDWMEGVFWLSKNTTADDVVFCDYVAGNYIAAYAGSRVYVGHGGQTVNYLSKLRKVKDFYSGNMSEDDAKLFLMKSYAKYIFAGPQEMDYGGGFLKYKFIRVVYKGKTTIIFRIDK